MDELKSDLKDARNEVENLKHEEQAAKERHEASYGLTPDQVRASIFCIIYLLIR